MVENEKFREILKKIEETLNSEDITKEELKVILKEVETMKKREFLRGKVSLIRDLLGALREADLETALFILEKLKEFADGNYNVETDTNYIG